MKKLIAITSILLVIIMILGGCTSTIIKSSTNQQNTNIEPQQDQLQGGNNEQKDKLCIDSDNGKNYNEKGEISVNGVVERVDSCSDAIGPKGPKLIEWYCDPSNEYGLEFSFEEYQCPGKCQDGICVEE